MYTAQCMKGELPAKAGLVSTRTKGNESKEMRVLANTVEKTGKSLTGWTFPNL